jgi:hypothetical protein
VGKKRGNWRWKGEIPLSILMQRKWGRKRKLEREGRNSIFDINAKKVGKKEEIGE